MKISAIILAAGSSSRMDGKNKQLAEVAGETVIYHTVKAFEDCSLVDNIVVVCKDGEQPDFHRALGDDFVKLSSLIVGGDTRFDSAKKAFLSLDNNTEFVVIHDGARCLITSDSITKVIESARMFGAATAASKITDTVKKCDLSGVVLNTVNRNELMAVQTPQVFSYEVYKKALYSLPEIHEEITDDNMLMEFINVNVHTVELEYENIKITTMKDLDFVSYILEKRARDGGI